MTYFPDLTPYRYGFGPLPWGADGPRRVEIDGLYGWEWGPGDAFDQPELAVGWLEPPHEYPRGATAAALVKKLERLCRSSRYHEMRGRHPCGFCGKPLGGLGSKEIRIAGGDVVYAAPNLIVHYVQAHRYAPPPGFVDALRDHVRQARPVRGLRRKIAVDLIQREVVEPAALEIAVRDAQVAERRDELFPELSIVEDAGCLRIGVRADFRPEGELLTRSWTIPTAAFLNLEQAAYGVCWMLESFYGEHMMELEATSKAPLKSS